MISSGRRAVRVRQFTAAKKDAGAGERLGQGPEGRARIAALS